MLKRLFTDRKVMLNVLMASSVVLIFTLFSVSAKVTGAGITLWVLVVLWNMQLSLSASNLSFTLIAVEIDRKYVQAKSNKNIAQQVLYASIFPLVSLGLVTVLFMLMFLFVGM